MSPGFINSHYCIIACHHLRGIQFAFLWPTNGWWKRLLPSILLGAGQAMVQCNNNEIGIPVKVFQLVPALIRL